MSILLVDDEEAIQKNLSFALERDGYRIVQARDGEEALALFASEHPDLVVLDLMLPKLDGIEVCKRLRAISTVPIIMLTARDDELDKVLGLELGADDYITKPFNIEALLARIRAILRRSGGSSEKGQISFHDIEIDLSEHRVTRNGRRVHLGPTEFRLLAWFMRHPRRVFSREDLLDAVWGRDIHVEPRTVDVHIRRLRKAINGEGELDIVRTVRAAGYALDTDPV